MYDDIVDAAGDCVAAVADRVRYSPKNPWSLQRYFNDAPEQEYVTAEEFDLGVMHNWLKEAFQGSTLGAHYITYQTALQKGMDKWDDDEQQPTGLDQADYTALLRTLSAAERLLDAQDVSSRSPYYAWFHEDNIEAGYRFVERAVETEDRVDAAYEELMVDALQQADDDLDDLFETKAHARFGPPT